MHAAMPSAMHPAMQPAMQPAMHPDILDTRPAPLFTQPTDEEESGWKYIHGDVFRFPPQKSLFCAFVGTGTQVGGRDACYLPAASLPSCLRSA